MSKTKRRDFEAAVASKSPTFFSPRERERIAKDQRDDAERRDKKAAKAERKKEAQ